MRGATTLVGIRGSYVFGDYFEMLGLRPAAGRLLGAADSLDGAEPVAVISHAFWRREFGGSSEIIGTAVTVSIAWAPWADGSVTIVGVAPRGFDGVNADVRADIWMPRSRSNVYSNMMGRLRDGATLSEAQAEADVLWASVSGEDSEIPRGYLSGKIVVERGASGYSSLRPEFYEPLLVLTGTTMLVLLVASANLGSLLLVRGASRRREIGIRLAMGTSRPRVVAHLLSESLVIGALGVVLGVVFAYWGGRLLVGYLPPESTFVPEGAMDFRVFAFTTLVSFGSVLAAGVPSAIAATRLDPNAILQGADSGSGGKVGALHRFVVAPQVAFSLVLLVVAGLFANTLGNLRNVDLGFDFKTVVQLRVELLNPQAIVPAERGDRIVDRIASLPGVRSVTSYHYSHGLFNESSSPVPFEVEGFDSSEGVPFADVFRVGAGFFETVGIEIVAGRGFRPENALSPERANVTSETERVGFEPTVEFPPGTLSKRAPSATRTSLHGLPDRNPVTIVCGGRRTAGSLENRKKAVFHRARRPCPGNRINGATIQSLPVRLVDENRICHAGMPGELLQADTFEVSGGLSITIF